MSRGKLLSKTFRAVGDHLVRTVALRDGRSYTQRCSFETYGAVAHFLEEHAAEGVTTSMIWDALPEVPCTQASVALDFLKERGCVRIEFRRCYPASGFLVEDAMCELHALAHPESESAPPTHLDYADEAESAQRAGAWHQAAALWRRAAETCPEDQRRGRCPAQARWCDDMAAIVTDER